MLYFASLTLVSKREGQIQSTVDDESLWKFFNLAPHSG